MNFKKNYSAHQIPKSPLLLNHTPDPHHPSTIPKPRKNEAPPPCPQDKSATQREPQGNEKPKLPQKPRKCNPVLFFFFKSTANKNKHKSPCPCKQWPPVLHPLKPKSRSPPEEESNLLTPRGSNQKNTLIPQML